MWLLPLVPLLAGIVAVVVASLRSGDDDPAAIELTSSAADFSTADDLVAASDLVVVATVADIADGRQITAPADPDAAVVTRLLVLDVSDVLAGSADGDVIVEEPAALGDGTPVVVDGIAAARRRRRGGVVPRRRRRRDDALLRRRQPPGPLHDRRRHVAPGVRLIR